MITSKENPHFKHLLKLHKRKERDRSHTFLVEGEREIGLAKGLQTLYFSERTPFVEAIKEKGLELIEMSEELLSRVTYRNEGMVAIATMEPASLTSLSNATFLLVVEAIEKPGNLGAIMRTADAAGVDGVIVSDPVVDIFNPNVIRASLGACFTIPIVRSTSEKVRAFLDEHNITPVITTPSARHSLYEVDLNQKIAIIIGSEAHGLSEAWMTNGMQIAIPMNGLVDSLNASTAAGIVLYEAVRQRSSLPR